MSSIGRINEIMANHYTLSHSKHRLIDDIDFLRRGFHVMRELALDWSLQGMGQIETMFETRMGENK